MAKGDTNRYTLRDVIKAVRSTQRRLTSLDDARIALAEELARHDIVMSTLEVEVVARILLNTRSLSDGDKNAQILAATMRNIASLSPAPRRPPSWMALPSERTYSFSAGNTWVKIDLLADWRSLFARLRSAVSPIESIYSTTLTFGVWLKPSRSRASLDEGAEILLGDLAIAVLRPDQAIVYKEAVSLAAPLKLYPSISARMTEFKEPSARLAELAVPWIETPDAKYQGRKR